MRVRGLRYFGTDELRNRLAAPIPHYYYPAIIRDWFESAGLVDVVIDDQSWEGRALGERPSFTITDR